MRSNLSSALKCLFNLILFIRKCFFGIGDFGLKRRIFIEVAFEPGLIVHVSKIL